VKEIYTKKGNFQAYRNDTVEKSFRNDEEISVVIERNQKINYMNKY
jgi:hypothetical protein